MANGQAILVRRAAFEKAGLTTVKARADSPDDAQAESHKGAGDEALVDL